MPKPRNEKGQYVKTKNAKQEIPKKPAPFNFSVQPTLQDILNIPRDRDFLGNVVLPHEATFAALYASQSLTYRTLDDEAKRDDYQNALAIRRDASIMKMIRARQYPTTGLPFTIEVENPEDPYQKEVARELILMINSIPNFHNLKLNLMEAVFFGKYAVQVEWNRVRVNGKTRVLPTKHIPVSGDKLVFKFCGTPGVLIYRPYMPKGADIEPTNWGTALFLTDPYYRDRFIIHHHEPDDVDYLYESDLAGARFGVGLRSRIYFVYRLRQQVLGWILDGMQRISTNGLLIGYFESGNAVSQEHIQQALKDLAQNSVCTIPSGQGRDQPNRIEAIAPATVAYSELFNALKYFDDILQVMISGQPLSSSTESTGMGSDVASLHAQTFEQIIRADSQSLAETLTRDLLGPIIKYNFGELDFGVKLKLQVDKTNVKDVLVSAKALYDMGVPLDVEDLRDKAGFIAPRDPDNAIVKKDTDDLRVGDKDKVGSLATNTDLEN